MYPQDSSKLLLVWLRLCICTTWIANSSENTHPSVRFVTCPVCLVAFLLTRVTFWSSVLRMGNIKCLLVRSLMERYTLPLSCKFANECVTHVTCKFTCVPCTHMCTRHIRNKQSMQFASANTWWHLASLQGNSLKTHHNSPLKQLPDKINYEGSVV